MKLYEKIKHGDRRTVVHHLNKGQTISIEDGVIVLKANVKLKAVEEFRGRTWVLITYDFTSMVEVEEARDDRPPPIRMPIPGGGVSREPRVVSLWEQIFGSWW